MMSNFFILKILKINGDWWRFFLFALIEVLLFTAFLLKVRLGEIYT
jgi:hypothetical protein